MKIIIQLLIIVIAVTLSSCASQYMTSSLPPQSIDKATIINPATYIEIIPKGKGNRTFYNDSLTHIANKNVDAGLYQYLSRHFQVELLEFDAKTKELVDFQLYQMIHLIEIKKKIELVSIPPSLDSIMTVNNIDYAICAIHSGFSREKGNYGVQVAKSVLLGLITLGNYYTVPVKAATELTICIIDRNRAEIAFHNKSYFQDLDPVDKAVTDKQIQQIFEKYFRY